MGVMKGISLDEVCEIICPLTIIKDKYNGIYSGGKYTAWNCDADRMPDGISGDNTQRLIAWDNIRKFEKIGFGVKYGIGKTIEEAVFDLYLKLI